LKRPFVERCWTLVGRHQGPFWYARRMRPTRGNPSSVDFDADWVLEREESGGDVVGFFHTHPPGVPGPSERDNRTMRAWVSSFGKPLLCLIESDHTLQAFLYADDESPATEVTACELLPRGIVIAYNEGDREDGR
jgi:proteasome lid subunit RPN8/RPN11